MVKQLTEVVTVHEAVKALRRTDGGDDLLVLGSREELVHELRRNNANEDEV